MISFEKIDKETVKWNKLDEFGDRTIFQTLPWLNFVSETQNAEPVIVKVADDKETLGYFTGLILNKFGIKILGSPFPGWTTSYMGFNLESNVERREIIKFFIPFVFEKLRCIHLEVMDRYITEEDCASLELTRDYLPGYEVDLSLGKDKVFSNFSKSCRRDIRRSKRNGIRIEISDQFEFAEEYYSQYEDVLDKKSLVPPYSIKRVKSLIKHLQPTGMLLLLKALRDDGYCIATGIFPAMNNVMYFWGGASWREHQHLLPNEAIVWFAIQYWMERGIELFDMGGGGGYFKRKFGGNKISVPRFRKSKYQLIPQLRDIGAKFFYIQQRLSGRVQKLKKSL